MTAASGPVQGPLAWFSDQSASIQPVAHYSANRVQIQVRIGPHLILDAASEPKGANRQAALQVILRRLRALAFEVGVAVFELQRPAVAELCLNAATEGDAVQALLERFDCPAVQASEAFSDGVALLRAAEKHGLEGVVSKRRGVAYRSGEVAIGGRSRRRRGVRPTVSGGGCSSGRRCRPGGSVLEPSNKARS